MKTYQIALVVVGLVLLLVFGGMWWMAKDAEAPTNATSTEPIMNPSGGPIIPEGFDNKG